MLQAQRDQIGDFGFSRTHDRIRAAPINLHRSIGFRDRAAGKYDVVNVSGDFPRIFRLQNPRVTHSDDLGRIVQIMKGNTQAINGSVHGLEDSMIDGEPSLLGLDRRRARADLHFVPVIRLGPHDELGFAPKT